MVTSLNPAHSTPHHWSDPPTHTHTPSICPTICYQSAELRKENITTVGWRLQKPKRLYCTVFIFKKNIFTSPDQQSSLHSCTFQSGVGALRVAWARRRWSLLKTKTNVYIVVRKSTSSLWKRTGCEKLNSNRLGNISWQIHFPSISQYPVMYVIFLLKKKS